MSIREIFDALMYGIRQLWKDRNTKHYSAKLGSDPNGIFRKERIREAEANLIKKGMWRDTEGVWHSKKECDS